jgi:hypothetical protein
MTRSNLIRCGGAIALVVCVVSICLSLRSGPGPRYEGRPLSYWLDHLKPAVWRPLNSREQFRSFAAMAAWDAEATKMHERSSSVLRNAGQECLPVLLARLTARGQPSRRGFVSRLPATLSATLIELAFALRLVDHVQTANPDGSQVRRGQAVAAIALLGDRAAPLVPKLSALTARGTDDDDVTIAAAIVLSRIAPDEFRGVRSPEFRRSLPVMPQESEPNGSANGSQPIRSETNRTSSPAGSRR